MLEAYIIIVLLGIALFVFLRMDMKKRWEKLNTDKSRVKKSLTEEQSHLNVPQFKKSLTEEQSPLNVPQWINDLLEKVDNLGIREKRNNVYAVRVDGGSPSITLWVSYDCSDVAVFVDGELVTNLITDQEVKKYFTEMMLRIVNAHKEEIAKRNHEESVRIVRSSLAMIGINNVDIK